jgi:hypothetical protein
MNIKYMILNACRYYTPGNTYQGTLISVDANSPDINDPLIHPTVKEGSLLFSSRQPLATPYPTPQYGIIAGMPIYNNPHYVPSPGNGNTSNLHNLIKFSSFSTNFVQFV